MKRLAALIGLVAMGAAPMSYADFRKLPQPAAPRTIAYGVEPLQHVELWRPAGKGPFPVVLMLHGGCWQTEVAKADIMHAAAADLMKHGIAVWNIDYRGVDVPGGGYPGTFADVAAAADLLAKDGKALGLATDHVIATGHSAGGHLALWLAARPRIARTSVLWRAHPLPIAGVVSLAGLPDLAEARTQAAEACGADTVDRLVGPATAAHAHVYDDTSPVALLPLGVPATLVNGAADTIAPPRFAASYAAKARRAGDRVSVITVPKAGHFELIVPGRSGWTVAVQALMRAVAMPATARSQPRPR